MNVLIIISYLPFGLFRHFVLGLRLTSGAGLVSSSFFLSVEVSLFLFVLVLGFVVQVLHYEKTSKGRLRSGRPTCYRSF
jgi:hypothetical protein